MWLGDRQQAAIISPNEEPKKYQFEMAVRIWDVNVNVYVLYTMHCNAHMKIRNNA